MDYEKYFNGYNVPDKIKNTAIAIMKRFIIEGLCDGMYICNVIAHQNGFGDGEGHFFETDKPIDAESTAEYLMHSYSSCIYKDEKEALKNILLTGSIDRNEAYTGIKSQIRRMKEELRTCDDFRQGYINRRIVLAKNTILALDLI